MSGDLCWWSGTGTGSGPRRGPNRSDSAVCLSPVESARRCLGLFVFLQVDESKEGSEPVHLTFQHVSADVSSFLFIPTAVIIRTVKLSAVPENHVHPVDERHSHASSETGSQPLSSPAGCGHVLYPPLLTNEIIKCDCVNSPCHSVYWFLSRPETGSVQFLGSFNNVHHPVYGDGVDRTRVQLNRRSSSSFLLRIINVTKEDAGFYSCIVKDRRHQETWNPGSLLLPGGLCLCPWSQSVHLSLAGGRGPNLGSGVFSPAGRRRSTLGPPECSSIT